MIRISDLKLPLSYTEQDLHTQALQHSSPIDGDCGGFNLHWAWVSGIVAGTSAAHILTQQENKP